MEILALLPIVWILVYMMSGKEAAQKKNVKGKSHEEFIEWFRQRELERSPDYVGYQKWLYEHRQKE